MFKYLATLMLCFSITPLYGKETLTVYTHAAFISASYGPGTPLKEVFEKTCDCTVQYVILDTVPLMMNRLALEGKKTKADVILGLEDMLLDMPNIENLVQDQSQIEKLTPFASHCLAFVYDSQKIPNPPQSLDELINSSYQVILQDPRTSITGLGFLVWMKKAYGDKAMEKWQKLAAHTLTFTKGWSEAYALFKGEVAPIVFSYTTDPLFSEIEQKKTNLKVMHFPEGHLCSHIYAGKMKTTHHGKLADQFIAFLLTPKAQHLIATHGWIYPVGKTPDLWLKAKNYLPKPASIPFTPQEVASYKEAWIQEWLEGMIR
jgi:thiamine transport system substrate-binding protein